MRSFQSTRETILSLLGKTACLGANLIGIIIWVVLLVFWCRVLFNSNWEDWVPSILTSLLESLIIGAFLTATLVLSIKNVTEALRDKRLSPSQPPCPRNDDL